MRLVLRIIVVVCIGVGSLALAAWGLSSFIGARSDLRASSPMQSEKRVMLGGPYGALANKAEEAGSPQVASLMFETSSLGSGETRRFDWADRPIRVHHAPMVIEHPHVAEATPLPPERPSSAPRLAALARPPAPDVRNERAPARNGAFTLPDVDSRTAIYDISARAVYLPGGRKLEAHSGLGEKMDNPRYVSVKNRGPTPPNVYNLTLREQPFHGVRAIRMTPVDDNNMFGRDGILAHSYMLGPSGQSNGCVSFSDYAAFLRAYMNGEVERIVVVARLPKSSAPALMSMRKSDDRYAVNSY